MKRVEVILTQALEEDFLEHYRKACNEMNIACKFTKYGEVYGQGNTTPKLGDAVWPQSNVMFTIFCEENLIPRIADIMKLLHVEYPDEGAASFVSGDASVLV